MIVATHFDILDFILVLIKSVVFVNTIAKYAKN